MISDLVLLKNLPEFIKKSVQAYTGCIAGAMRKEEYMKLIEDAGFRQIDVQGEEFFSLGLETEDVMAKASAEEMEIPIERLRDIARSVVSIKVGAIKPKV